MLSLFHQLLKHKKKTKLFWLCSVIVVVHNNGFVKDIFRKLNKTHTLLILPHYTYLLRDKEATLKCFKYYFINGKMKCGKTEETPIVFYMIVNMLTNINNSKQSIKQYLLLFSVIRNIIKNIPTRIFQPLFLDTRNLECKVLLSKTIIGLSQNIYRKYATLQFSGIFLSPKIDLIHTIG